MHPHGASVCVRMHPYASAWCIRMHPHGAAVCIASRLNCLPSVLPPYALPPYALPPLDCLRMHFLRMWYLPGISRVSPEYLPSVALLLGAPRGDPHHAEPALGREQTCVNRMPRGPHHLASSRRRSLSRRTYLLTYLLTYLGDLSQASRAAGAAVGGGASSPVVSSSHASL